jgi:uncharacterized protein YndB with AHSA1/START domain
VQKWHALREIINQLSRKATICKAKLAKMLHGVEIAAEPKTVFDAITTQKGLSSWWTSDSIVPKGLQEEKSISEFGFEKHAVVFKMRSLKISPKLVLWSCVDGPDEWKGTHLKWEISKTESGSELRFTHSRWKKTGEYFRSCNSTWGNLMYRLKSYAETGKVDPLFA